MPGSGKSYYSKLISDAIKAPVFAMGDVVREEVSLRGLPLTIENIERVATELREKQGKGIVASLLLKKIEGCNSNIILIDGIRSLEEIEVIEKKYDVCLIAIHAPPAVRFKRVMERNRGGKGITLDEFKFRDMKNLEYGVGEVIALSDYIIINDTDKGPSETFGKVLGAIKDGSWKSYCRGGVKAYRG